MNKTLLLLLVGFFACHCQVNAIELIVDWSLDLREPPNLKAPDLQLFNPQKRLIYTIEGELKDTLADQSRYIVPSEAAGKCYLSYAGGMNESRPLDGVYSVTIDPNEDVLRVKFPSSSLVLEVNVPTSLAHREIQIYKLDANGIPLPNWTWTNDLSQNIGDGKTRFIVPFLNEGRFLAYIVEPDSNGPSKYISVKSFLVTDADLVKHDAKMQISDLRKSKQKIQLVFGSQDSHIGPVVVTSTVYPCTFISLTHDGKVISKSKSEE
jgi:hypothetical protein